MQYLRAVLGVFIGLTLCALASAGESEVVIGYTVSPRGVTFQVNSNGCTQAKDFSFLRQLGDPVGVELIRNVPDLCERIVPFGLPLTFSYAEIGLKPGSRFSIANKLQATHVVPK